MKKLLLYLMALLAFGTVPLDSFGAVPSTNLKTIYIEDPGGTKLLFWWFRNGNNTDSDKWEPTNYTNYTWYNQPDLKKLPNDTYLKVSEETIAGKTFYKVQISENADGFILNQKGNGNITIKWDEKYYHTCEYWYPCQPAYFVKSGNNKVTSIWWWNNNNNYAQNDPNFDWRGDNITDADHLRLLHGSIVKDQYGTEYYKVFLPEDTNNIILNWGSTTHTFSFDKTWNSQGGGQSVSSLTFSPVEGGNPYENIYVNWKSANNDWTYQKAGHLDGDGKIEFKVICGSQGGFNFQFVDEGKTEGLTYLNENEFEIELNKIMQCAIGTQDSYLIIPDYNVNKDKDKEFTVQLDYANKTVKVIGEVSGITEQTITVRGTFNDWSSTANSHVVNVGDTYTFEGLQLMKGTSTENANFKFQIDGKWLSTGDKLTLGQAYTITENPDNGMTVDGGKDDRYNVTVTLTSANNPTFTITKVVDDLSTKKNRLFIEKPVNAEHLYFWFYGYNFSNSSNGDAYAKNLGYDWGNNHPDLLSNDRNLNLDAKVVEINKKEYIIVDLDETYENLACQFDKSEKKYHTSYTNVMNINSSTGVTSTKIEDLLEISKNEYTDMTGGKISLPRQKNNWALARQDAVLSDGHWGAVLEDREIGTGKFAIATRLKEVPQYWGIKNAVIEPGTTYQLEQLKEADAKTMTVKDAYSSSTYNVIFDWTTKEMTLTNPTHSDDVWYLYQSSSNTPASFETAKRDGVRLSKQGNDLYTVTGISFTSGNYIYLYDTTGQWYNLDYADNGVAYYLNNDNWSITRKDLTHNDNKKAGIYVDTENMKSCQVIVDPNADGNNKKTITIRNWEALPDKVYIIDGNGNVNSISDANKFVFDDINEYWRLDGKELSKGDTFKIVVVDHSGTKTYWSLKETTVNNTSNAYKVDGITGRELVKDAKAFEITTNIYHDGSSLVFDWNGGNPLLRIDDKSTPKRVKVYFVDRAKWHDVRCYNYTDATLTENTNEVGVSERNAAFPGAPMHECTEEAVLNGIDREVGVEIYEITLDVNVYEDGNYERPKVIFAKEAGKQTNNLYLVDGGIYSNAGGDVTATEYMPRMFFNHMADADDQEVMIYPNDFYYEDYNVIYVDVPEFTESVVEKNGTISVQIEWDQNGNNVKDFIATGIPGKHHLNLVTIGEHQYLRVAIAEDVVPNQTPIKLSVWMGADKTTDISKDNNHTNQTSNKYDGKHLYCHNSGCSLIFNNVEFADGNVYRRIATENNGTQEAVVSIRELESPKHFYIVCDTEQDAKAFENAKAEGKTLVQEEIGDKYYFEITTNDPKIIYTVSKVRNDNENSEVNPQVKAKFHFAAQFSDDGDMIPYSNEADKRMRGGNWYSFKNRTGQPEHNYSINDDNLPATLKEYELQIDWTNAVVSVTPVPVNAEFEYNGDSGYTYHVMPAHHDDCDNWTYVPIKHVADYDAHKFTDVNTFRPSSYNKYFSKANSKNNPAVCYKRVIKPNPDDGYDEEDLALIPANMHPDYVNGPAENTPSDLSYAKVKAYTAGVFTIRVNQVNNTEKYKNSTFDLPVRVYATPYSIGLQGNWYDVYPYKGSEDLNKLNELFAEGPDRNSTDQQFIIPIFPGINDGYPNSKWEIKDENNNSWDASKILLTPTGADVTDSYGNRCLTIYWKYDDNDQFSGKQNSESDTNGVGGSSVAYRPADEASASRTILRTVNALSLVTDDPNAAKLTSDYLPQSNTHAIDASQGDRKVKLIIQQNGVTSEPYDLLIKSEGMNDNIPTEVDTVLGVEEGEVVYYNLNGVRVDAKNLEPGIYVKVQGTKSEKVYIR